MGTYIIASPQNESELYHHGILGMHWGIRRYQPYPDGYNGDGKFLGKLRERHAQRKAMRQEKRHQKALKGSTSAEKLMKNKKYLTEEEFEKKANQFILEKQLKDCYETKEVSIGKKAVDKVMTDVTAGAIKLGLIAGAGYLVSKTPMGQEILKNAKGVFATAKKIFSATKEHNGIRGAVANTDAAKAYVNTVNSVMDTAKETRKAAAESDLGRAYVKAVKKVAGTKPVKGVIRDMSAIRKRAATSDAAKKYVGTIKKFTKRKVSR